MITTKKYASILISVFLVCAGIYFISRSTNNVPLEFNQSSDKTINSSTSPLPTTTPNSPNHAMVDSGKALQNTPVVNPADIHSGMTLTFNEDFKSFKQYTDADGNISCGPGGSGIWQTVYHFCSRTNASNFEAELYIDPQFIAHLKKVLPIEAQSDPDNPFSTDNGILTITAKPSSKEVIEAAGWWAKYTSGFISTQFSFSQQYGYFEMRAKMPKGKGLWPAFWLLPIDKSWPPEIDVMEFFGDVNEKGEGGLTKIHYASHAIEKGKSCGEWADMGVDLTVEFHTYGVKWEPSGFIFYFDDKPYATCPTNTDANQPMYLVANLAVGGAGSWPGEPNSATVWPSEMNIDYIRAYKLK